MTENRAILYQPFGGLGDNLAYSTLPELYSKRGVDFFVSNKNVYRNDEIKKLVWDLNPYVKGTSDEIPNIGYNGVVNGKNNHIERVEGAYGFENSGNKYPKVYYEPKIIEELKNKTILSLNSIAITYDNILINKILKKLINDDETLLLKFQTELMTIISGEYNNNKYPHKDYLFESDIYVINDIFHHCDVIASCKRYITLASGSAVLASAIISKTNIKNTEVILFGQWINMILQAKHYYFDNLTYIYD